MQLEYGALKDLATYVSALPEKATTAARIALNDTIDRTGLALYRDAVADQAAFPPGYLNDDRLGVEQRATNADLTVKVIGRNRPTSLARFVRSANPKGGYGVRVEVKHGHAAEIKRGFVISLKNGNKGLALRLRPGERPTATKGARELGKGSGVFLLYGPSVNQLLGEAGDQKTPEVLKRVEAEFYRQFFRK